VARSPDISKNGYERGKPCLFSGKSSLSRLRLAHFQRKSLEHNDRRGRILNDRVEIPIERATSLRPTSRGFLPWRVSDDGPG
jgi:hypothetical protein